MSTEPVRRTSRGAARWCATQVPDADTAVRPSVETGDRAPSRVRLPMRLLGLLDPLGLARTAVELPGAVITLARTVSRIVELLQQWDGPNGALRELSRMHGVLDRLERLGAFLGEELLEAQHQMELLRRSLLRQEQNTEELITQLSKCTDALQHAAAADAAAVATVASTVSTLPER